MCELLAVRAERVTPFAEIRSAAEALEAGGIAGFGWGVAWLMPGHDRRATVRAVRGLGRFADEAAASPELAAVVSTHWLVHLRRPSRLSTIGPPDTQPFIGADHDHAWCHNGYFARAEKVRPAFAGRLAGRADSEVGWQWWLDRREGGVGPVEALRDVDEELGGHVNLGYLGADGALAVYGRNPSNNMWAFRVGSTEMASTGLHSDDGTLFESVFPGATERRRLAPGEIRVLGAHDVAYLGAGEGGASSTSGRSPLPR